MRPSGLNVTVSTASMWPVNVARFSPGAVFQSRTVVSSLPVARVRPSGLNLDADWQAGRRIDCPLQVLWATRDDMADLYGDVLGIWRDWAVDRLDGGPIASGHHIAEEAPEVLVTALREFWRSTEEHGPRKEHTTGKIEH